MLACVCMHVCLLNLVVRALLRTSIMSSIDWIRMLDGHIVGHCVKCVGIGRGPVG